MWTLPQQVVCEECGRILYDGVDLRPPEELIQEYDGKCPKCGKKLSFAPKKIEIKSVK
ncbi:MAG: hypothetical protein JSV12_02635 [Candidatus Bathyarchaeota archaeon]|nr:MAG: hypothetical protein JSV12_02635 [Candidatus Bathyarchaeota archaeon]